MEATNQSNPDIKYKKDKLISKWLFVCCFFVAIMVLIGGLTRLTGSGLSMTDWHPVHGVIPPIGEAEWLEEFSNYKQSPEYQQINMGMELSEFKFIFMWEYVHRIAGRITGIVFLLPLLFFMVTKRLKGIQALKLLGVLLIGAFQGVIGWWMVKSGLYDKPAVSHFRLAIHLTCAFLIFSILFWQALNFYLSKQQQFLKFKNLVNILLALLTIQIVYGAFIAGLDGGLTYNTWPLMDGEFVPQGFISEGLYSIFNDIISIQFIHRWLAFAILFVTIYYVFKIKASIRSGELTGVTATRLKKSSNMMIAVLVLQIFIGIKTLIMVVPVPLASLHQMTALILLGGLVYIRRAING